MFKPNSVDPDEMQRYTAFNLGLQRVLQYFAVADKLFHVQPIVCGGSVLVFVLY